MQFYEGKINLLREKNFDVAEVNKILAEADEKILPIIFSAKSDALEIILMAETFDRVDEKQVEKIFSEFGAVKNIFLREILPSRAKKILQRAEEENFIGSYLAHVQNNFQENFSADYFDNPNFKLEENLIYCEPLNFHEAMKNSLVDKNFLDELKRIYSSNHPKKFFGHPVHYKITAKNFSVAKKIAALLCRALYTNKRLVSGCMNFIFDVKESCFGEIDIENIFRQSAGAAVILNLNGTNEIYENFATARDEVTNFFADLVKKYQSATLFIFVESESSNFTKKLAANLKIVELEEKILNRAEALATLKDLLKNLNYGDAEISDALGENFIFRPSDVHEIFERLQRENLSRNIYVDYKNLGKITVEENFSAEEDDAHKILQKMAGLTEVKNILRRIIDSFKVQKLRAEFGLKNFRQSLHMVFIGNPGTAKTTVARLFAQILSKNFVECGRADLVGKYIGWTAPAVEKKFREARGGILFIDEAYSLLDENFGNEAINEIVRQMEIFRRETIVIFAGYPEKMKNFLEQNEGLRSRISFTVNFPDYDVDELTEILKFMADGQNLKISSAVVKKCKKIFAEVYHKKNFGNGRFVRNLLEQAILKQSQRILRENKKISRAELSELKPEDFDENFFAEFTETKIGFTP